MEQVDLKRQREWEGEPGKLGTPKEYIEGLRYEVIVFARKERGGSDFSFRCRDYRRIRGGQWKFTQVMIDTSKKDAQGEVVLARLTYHPEVRLADIGFMVIPAVE
jgi:hypothetical protein